MIILIIYVFTEIIIQIDFHVRAMEVDDKNFNLPFYPYSLSRFPAVSGHSGLLRLTVCDSTVHVQRRGSRATRTEMAHSLHIKLVDKVACFSYIAADAI